MSLVWEVRLQHQPLRGPVNPPCEHGDRDAIDRFVIHHGHVTSGVLTPWYRRSAPASGEGSAGWSADATAILDFKAPAVTAFATRVRGAAADDLDVLRLAHGHIAACVAPVYALNDEQRVSRTLLR